MYQNVRSEIYHYCWWKIEITRYVS